MQWLANIALVLVSVGIGFLAINATFPLIFHQSLFPRALVRSAGDFQYTFYPDTYDRRSLDSWIAVVGDSYAQGMGDSYINNDSKYSISHHLRDLAGGNYLIFGRSGFGSITAVRELVIGVKIMHESLLFPDLNPPRQILILFYEGNDLNDNLIYAESAGSSRAELSQFVRSEIDKAPSLRDRVDSQLPFARLFYNLVRENVHQFLISDEQQIAMTMSNRLYMNGKKYRMTSVQGAAVDLSRNEIERALAIFGECLRYLRRWAPDAKIYVVYIPSVATSYDWNHPIEIDSYHRKTPIILVSEINLRQSELIRGIIGELVVRLDCDFIDSTEEIRARAKAEILHGPRDWRHLNARGYQVVASVIARSLEGR